jgi:hypothetical protein
MHCTHTVLTLYSYCTLYLLYCTHTVLAILYLLYCIKVSNQRMKAVWLADVIKRMIPEALHRHIYLMSAFYPVPIDRPEYLFIDCSNY